MIKSWLKFNEGNQLDIFQNTPYDRPELIHNNLYPMDEDDIRDYLIELDDAHYTIVVNFGFCDGVKYTERITSREMTPCVSLDIHINQKTSDEDVTTGLRSFVKRVASKFKSVTFHDDSGQLNIRDLKVQGGVFIKSDTGKIEDELEIEYPLEVHLNWFVDVALTDKMIFEYYGFEDYMVKFTENGTVQIGFPVDVISDWVIDKNSPYKGMIDDPDYDIEQWYDRGSEWIPDHDSFFRYHLENDTINMLLEYCFKDFENIKIEYDDNSFISKYNSKDELIGEIMNTKSSWSKHWTELGKFLDDSEVGANIYNELRVDYADWSVDAKINDDYKKVFEEFDDVVEKKLETSIVEKFENEERKRIKSGDVWKEITYQRPYYRIDFNINWIYGEDSSNLFNRKLVTHMSDWTYNCIERVELNPNFSDYADVDDKLFNIEVRRILKNEINKIN